MSGSDPTNYELMVQALLSTRLASAGVSRLQSYHLKKYQGKTGQEYEIDVSFEIEMGELRFLVLVECKQYARAVDVDVVQSFLFRLRDIGAHKGILVTTRGFQAGAVRLAKAEGLALVVACHGQRENWWMGWLPSPFISYATALVIAPDVAVDQAVRLYGDRHYYINEKWAVAPLGVSGSHDPRQTVTYLLSPAEYHRAFPEGEGPRRPVIVRPGNLERTANGFLELIE